MDTFPTTTFLSIRVNIPVRTAVAAFDDLLLTGGGQIVADGARLTSALDAVSRIPVPRNPSYVAYRTARGVLSAPHIRRRVDVEFAPWSNSATELGLRPAGRRIRQSDPGIEYGYRVLARLRDLINNWADEPLRRMTTATSPTPVEDLSRCYVLLQADPGTTGEVVRQARELPAVADATATTGSYDVVVHAIGDSSGLRQLPEALRRLPGVSRVLICLPKT
jgi:hypothetical protein